MSRNGAAVVSAFRLLLRPSGVSRHRGLRLAPVTAFALHLRPCGGHELQQHRTFAATTSDDDGKHPLDKHKTPLETGGLEGNHAKEEVKVQEDVKTHEAESKKSDENELEVSKAKAEDNDSIKKAVIADSSEQMDREIQENPLQVIEKNINEGRSKEIVKKESESKQETPPLCTDGIKQLNDSGKDSPRKELTKFESQKPKHMKNKEDNRKCIKLTRKINNESGNGKAIGNGKSFPDDIFVEYVNGMPHMTVRLPSRNELCQFALKPISHNVGDLLSMLREEDRGIDRAAVINKNGVRIASSCTIDSLLDDTFSIQINNRTMEVNPPKRDKITLESMDKVGDVRKVIAQLYEAFNVGEYQLEKSNQLAKELESIRYELEPLEEKKLELSKKATRRTNFMTWMGLGLMSVQFGILARLTWWEYSWDIMEPVTYFVTYGTTMAMYAYYCVTKREYMMEAVKNREYSLTIYKNAKKMQFDVEHYNQLKRKTAELEYNLRRINDPLNMQLPSHLVRTQENTPPTDQQPDEAREGKSN